MWPVAMATSLGGTPPGLALKPLKAAFDLSAELFRQVTFTSSVLGGLIFPFQVILPFFVIAGICIHVGNFISFLVKGKL